MSIDRRITGTDDGEFLFGGSTDDKVWGRGGDDNILGRNGWDRLFGENGFDNLYGGADGDRLFGGAQNDNLYGGYGEDILHGDSGRTTAKLSDFGSDNLNGGRGDDILFAGDGNDTLTGGAGKDKFYFKWQDPMINLAVSTGRAFATLTDFDPDADTLVFDAPGVGKDSAGANFIDGGAGDGTPGGKAASFFKGDPAASNGEAVMVLDAFGFATGADAVLAAQNEAMGDFVLYFNTTVSVASLLFVDALDTAHSIARFSNIDSIEDLQAANFTASDFTFA